MIFDHKFIGLSRESSTRVFVDRAFATIGRVVDPSYEVGHLTTVAGIVAEGLGVTVIPNMARALIHHPSIVFRRIHDPVVSREICLIKQQDRSLSPAATVLWDMILKEDILMSGPTRGPSV
jgi:DNA-binding transcriptional LysR family regulator